MKPGRKALIEILLTGLLLIVLATALARRAAPPGPDLVEVAVVLNTKTMRYSKFTGF